MTGPGAARPAPAKVAAVSATAIGNARPVAAVREPAIGNRAIAELAGGEAGLDQARRSVIQRFAAERKPLESVCRPLAAAD